MLGLGPGTAGAGGASFDGTNAIVFSVSWYFVWAGKCLASELGQIGSEGSAAKRKRSDGVSPTARTRGVGEGVEYLSGLPDR